MFFKFMFSQYVSILSNLFLALVLVIISRVETDASTRLNSATVFIGKAIEARNCFGL